MSSNFEKALDNLLGFEKGYANIEGDRGGETYAGIARNFHPSWLGWQIIDNYKRHMDGWKTLLDKNEELQSLVYKFYKDTYWDKFNGDKLQYEISAELLEEAVNMGTAKTAGINLQEALNYLNKAGKVFPNLVIDGYIGQNTLKAVSLISSDLLLKVLNGLQFCHYKKLMDNNITNRKFVGWFSRV